MDVERDGHALLGSGRSVQDFELTLPDRKKIVHVIAALNTGGAEMMLYKLLSRRNRYDEQVICLSGHLDTAVAQKILELGVKVEALRFSKRALNLRALCKLRSTIKLMDPDIIHGWMYHGNVAATLASRWAPRAALIWNVRHSLHDIRHERRLVRASIKANRRLSSRPGAIVYNSKTSAAQHAEFGFDIQKAAVLPNGFDCDVFTPNPDVRDQAREQHELSAGTLAVGVVARHHPMKGHDVCLAAVSQAVGQGADVRLFLIGARLDSDNLPLVDEIGRHGLKNRVTLLGECDQLENLYPMLDVLVSSSLWGEAFSNSIGEAMACSVATIVTDIGDSAWIVGDTGVVVPPGDAAALADAIEKLASDPIEARHKQGAAARARVIEHYSIARVAGLYDDLYQKLTMVA